MGIVSVQCDEPGQVGVRPRRVKVVTTDDLATVTAAGYFNNITLQGQSLYPTDMIDCTYSYVRATNSGTDIVLTVAINNGVVTASQQANPGNIVLPVVSGNLAQFNGTNGLVSDSGIVASAVQVFTASITLSQADVLAAYATPVLLIAAPGAGKVIVPLQATIYTNFQTTAFADGGVAIVQYDNTVHGAGTNALAATIPSAEITASASQIYNLGAHTAAALTGITNVGLYFSNATGAFTGGDAASTVVITIDYQVVTATV